MYLTSLVIYKEAIMHRSGLMNNSRQFRNSSLALFSFSNTFPMLMNSLKTRVSLSDPRFVIVGIRPRVDANSFRMLGDPIAIRY
jgi:hypothetical protein